MADVEAGLEAVPAWLLAGVHDVFLLGARSDLHVPSTIVRPVVDALERFDAGLAKESRALLDVQYGVCLHRSAADPRNVERLLARVPRAKCSEVTEADLVELARRVGPLYDQAALRHVRTCHLVAEQDHLRFRPQDFLGDLVERWLQVRPGPPAQVPPSAPLPRPPEPRTRRVEDVTPVVEIEEELIASPDPEVIGAQFKDAEDAIAQNLAEAGYVVTRAPSLEDETFRLEATRAPLWPHKVALWAREAFARPDAEEALRLVREGGLDLLVVIVGNASDEALRRLTASKVKVVRPSEAPAFRA